jgi:uncharacterized protein (TIGR03083 family)
MDPATLVDLIGTDPVDLMDRETERIDRFYAGLDDAGWAAPTHCAEWNRRQLLAHLASIEDYIRAGLDGTVAELLAGSGAGGLEDFNDWGVRQHAGLSPADLLAEWRTAAAENRRRLRERPLESTLDTSVGPYPFAAQVYYLTSELAIHADDAGVPVTAGERAERTAWRSRFARVALAEADRGVTVEDVPGRLLVGLDGEAAGVDEEDFVAATAGRLRPEHPLPAKLRAALVVLA